MASTASDERRPLRRARGLVVGVVAGLLAVVGHALGGGSVPGPAAWGAVLLVVAGTVLASTRRWTPGRLAVALLGAQALVHGGLWLTSPTGPADARLVGLARLSGPAGVGPGEAHAHVVGLEPRMVLAHLCASLVAVSILAVLERCALGVHAAMNAVRLALAPRPVPASPRRVPVQPDVQVPTGLVVVGRRPRRGPPALLAPC